MKFLNKPWKKVTAAAGVIVSAAVGVYPYLPLTPEQRAVVETAYSVFISKTSEKPDEKTDN